jgi:biotin-dependent carboxylase-like uncharacterized protein
MTGGLRIITPGLMTTVQDLGRFGFQAFGVPVSGALDPEALRLANALVGNAPGTAGLELGYTGPSFEVTVAAARFAVVGGGAGLRASDGRFAPEGTTLRAAAGTSIQVVPLRSAATAILAVAGGFALKPFMGSLSTYTRGPFGGFEGRALQAGDLLPLAFDTVPDDTEYALPPDAPEHREQPIRVVLGPQEDFFSEATIGTLLSTRYTVTRDADRMGLRLEGPPLEHLKGFNIVSDGIVTGTIQVPGTGLPILLLADHHTVGGYPKIGTVISADLPRLGRLRPGETLSFAAIDIAQAETARRDAELALSRRIARIGPVSPDGTIDVEALLRENLISGVIDASEQP